MKYKQLGSGGPEVSTIGFGAWAIGGMNWGKTDDEVSLKALKYGIGVIVRIPLLFGFLTGKFTAGSTFGEEDHRKMNLSPEKLQGYLEELQKLQPLFDHFKDQSMAQVSLRFCISHPACHTAIPGAKTSLQVQENVASSDLGPIPEKVIKKYIWS